MQNEPKIPGGEGRVSAELSELQALHDPLLRAYTGISQRTSLLDPARLYLFAHIRDRSVHLRGAYTAAAQSEDRPDLHEWLSKRSDDLTSFIEELDTNRDRLQRLLGVAKKGWSFAAAIYAAVVSVFGLTAVGTTLSAFLIAVIRSCFCEVFRYGAGIFMASFILIGVFGFSWQRQTLCDWTPKASGGDNAEMPNFNVYEMEEKLLSKLDTPRKGQIQWDVITWFLLAGITIGIRYLVPIISRYTERPVIFVIDWFYLAAIYAAAGIIALWLSLRRPWGWRPMI
jgi:hypothetical protein